MPFPWAAALGLGSAIAGALSKPRAAQYSLQMDPTVKRNYFAYLQNLKSRQANQPNMGLSSAQQGMGVLGNAMGWGPGQPDAASAFGTTPGQAGFSAPQQTPAPVNLAYAQRRQLG